MVNWIITTIEWLILWLLWILMNMTNDWYGEWLLPFIYKVKQCHLHPPPVITINSWHSYHSQTWVVILWPRFFTTFARKNGMVYNGTSRWSKSMDGSLMLYKGGTAIDRSPDFLHFLKIRPFHLPDAAAFHQSRRAEPFRFHRWQFPWNFQK